MRAEDTSVSGTHGGLATLRYTVEPLEREVKLLRIRESKLLLEVQELAARNRELESHLNVYTMAQPILRAAEAEGARWCAPSFRPVHGVGAAHHAAHASPHKDARAPSVCMASLHVRCVYIPGSLI
jgi:hypothetical protein